jgi:pyrroline-5-carboxylate reductase
MHVGIIGVGTIGEILAEGLNKEGHKLFAYDIRSERLQEVADRCDLRKAPSNVALIEWSEVVVVAVKPQTFESLMQEISDASFDGKVFVSVLAGVATRSYEEQLPEIKVVRIMPNLPIKIGKGVVGFCRGKNVTDEEEKMGVELLQPFGAVERVPEEKMDAVTALTGSGPGFVFAIIEALADAGVRVGLDHAQALRMAAHMMAGSAEMIEATGKHPAALRNAVCSPGGTTIAGISVMEEMGLRGILMEAVAAAYNRAKELT